MYIYTRSYYDTKQTILRKWNQPRIGVIVMVAITVILSAVIGVFVLELGGDVSKTSTAGVDVEESNGDVAVTYISEGNADTVTILYNGSEVTTLDSVGDSKKVYTNSGDTVTVVGETGDSKSTINSVTSDTTSESVSNGDASAGTLEANKTTTTTVVSKSPSQTLLSGDAYTVTFTQDAQTSVDGPSKDEYIVTYTGSGFTEAGSSSPSTLPEETAVVIGPSGSQKLIDPFDSQTQGEIKFTTEVDRDSFEQTVELTLTNNTRSSQTIDTVTVERVD